MSAAIDRIAAPNNSVKSGSRTSPSASSPGNGEIGFRRAGSPIRGPARSATVIVKRPSANAAYQATGRQRGDNSRPSGKTRNKDVGITPVVGSQSQEPNHAAHSPPGRPGCTRYAYALYIWASS